MRKNVKRLMVFTLLSLITIFMLAGCSSKEQDNKVDSQSEKNVESSENTSNSKEESSIDSEEEVESGDPVKGGEITVAFMASPTNFDMDAGAGWPGSIILNHVYEGLFEFNEEGSAIPHLAESYEILDGGKVYDIILRKGVKFSDGEEMKAEDVKASMERWLLVNEAGVNIAPYLDNIEIIDDYEIKVNFKEIYAPFINMISSPVSAQKLTIKKKDIVEKFGTDVITEHIGTGPYQFEEIVLGQKVILSRNENYTPCEGEISGTSGKREAYLDKITIEFVPEESVRVAGLQSGQYDFVDEVSTERYDELESMPNVEPVKCNFGTINVIALNCGGDIFKDKLIRQAVTYAINNEELGAAQIGDERFWTVGDGSWFKEGSIWHDGEAGKEIYNAKDTDKAKQLLEEAGYNGEKIVIIGTKTDTFQSDGAIVLQTQLQDIGMNVEIELYDDATMTEKRNNGDWDMLISRWSDMNPDPQVFGPWTGTDGWITRWDDEESKKMDDIFARMIVENDQESRKEIVKEFYNEFWATTPYIKSFNDYRLYGMSEKLNGFEAYGQPYFWNVWIAE